MVDEAWAHEDGRLEQGLSPTMITRPQPQLWVVSTAGTHRSAYLRGKVERGRRGPGSTVAYFEWSALPGSDPGDPQTWWGCMRALGHTVTEARIRHEFERLDLADPESVAVDPVAFAADVTPERSHAVIATAGLRPDGLDHAEVVDHRPGTGRVVGRLVELAERWQPCAVVVDEVGPAGSLVAPLEAAGLEVVKPSTRVRAAADGGFYDAVAEGSLRYVPRPALDAAVAGAATRPLGMPGRGPARAYRPISRPWSRCRWPAGATPPGRTSTTASRASTSERATTPGLPFPGVVVRTGPGAALQPGLRADGVPPKVLGGPHPKPPTSQGTPATLSALPMHSHGAVPENRSEVEGHRDGPFVPPGEARPYGPPRRRSCGLPVSYRTMGEHGACWAIRKFPSCMRTKVASPEWRRIALGAPPNRPIEAGHDPGDVFAAAPGSWLGWTVSPPVPPANRSRLLPRWCDRQQAGALGCSRRPRASRVPIRCTSQKKR